MSGIKKDQIKHIAKLAGLNLSEEEVKKFQIQLSKVVSFIHNLSEVDTKNIEPTSQTTGLTNSFREDTNNENETLTKADALSGTERNYNGYFIVPMILEERSDY